MKTTKSVKRAGYRFARYPAFIVFVLIMIYCFKPVYGIVLMQNDRIEKFFHVEKNQEVYIEYIHSVAKVPVKEIFLIMDNEKMLLIRTEYSAFGAGLPTDSFGTFTQEGDRYINSGIDQMFMNVPLRVGKIANHRMVVDGKFDFEFSERFEPGSLVLIQPIKTFRIRALMLN